jgi:hypothetical protein
VSDQRQRKPIVITPRVGGILGGLATVMIGYVAITGIDQGRSTVRAQWALAVTVGAGTSSGLIAVLAASIAVARWRQRVSRVLVPPMAWLSGAVLLITVVGLRIVGGSGVVASPWEVGLAAFMLPVACLASVLIPLLTWRRRSPGQAQAQPDVRRLLVATITARGDRWSVHWTGMGKTPGPQPAATLTAATGQALTAASALQARTATELRIMIYPGPYRGGPSFDITGEPGDLTATSTHHPGETFHAGTLEDLADAICRTRMDGRKGFRLRWIRQIMAPIAPAPLPEQRPSRE